MLDKKKNKKENKKEKVTSYTIEDLITKFNIESKQKRQEKK